MSSQDVSTLPFSEHKLEPPPSSDALLPSSPSPVKVDVQHSHTVEHTVPEAPNTTTPTSTHQDPKPSNPRLTALAARQAHLESKLASLQASRATMVAHTTPTQDPPTELCEEQQLKHALAHANAVIREHIALLHGYNAAKDVGLGLMGLVADARGARVAAVMEEFGMSAKD